MDDIAEWAAVEFFLEAGAELSNPPGTVALARAVLGDDCFRYLPVNSMAGGAVLCRVAGRWFIYVARTLTGHRLNHAVGHELGHVYCSRINYHPADEEQVADRIGSALCAPRDAFLAAHREHGAALRPLARRFTMSMASAALRLGETTEMPIALARADRVRIRGAEWDWPDHGDLLAGVPVAGASVRKVERGALAYCVA